MLFFIYLTKIVQLHAFRALCPTSHLDLFEIVRWIRWQWRSGCFFLETNDWVKSSRVMIACGVEVVASPWLADDWTNPLIRWGLWPNSSLDMNLKSTTKHKIKVSVQITIQVLGNNAKILVCLQGALVLKTLLNK